MKSYLELVPISAKVHKRKNRMSIFCITLAVFLVTTIFGMADMFVRSQIIKTQAETGNWHIGLKNISEDNITILSARSNVLAISPYDILNYNGELGFTLEGTDTVICGSDESLLTNNISANDNRGQFPTDQQRSISNE